MDREISFSWNMIKKRRMFESTNLISTPNLVCVPPSFVRVVVFWHVARCVSACMYICCCCFFGIVLSTNIKCCIGVNKYSWPTLVIATLTNAKLSHIHLCLSRYVDACLHVCLCASVWLNLDGLDMYLTLSLSLAHTRTRVHLIGRTKNNIHTHRERGRENIWTRFNFIKKKCEFVKKLFCAIRASVRSANIIKPFTQDIFGRS